MASPEYDNFYKEIVKKRSDPHVPIEEQRANFEKFMSEFPHGREIVIEPFKIGDIMAAWCHAPKARKDKVIFFLHGGGFNAGTAASHSDFLGKLSKITGAYVLAIDYRLAPEHPYPAGLEDAVYAYRWLARNICHPSRIILCGSSAGGGLAMSLLLALKMTGEIMPTAVTLLSPWVDLTFAGKSYSINEGSDIVRFDRLKIAAEMYIGKHDPKHPLISPLYGDLHGLPPMLIQVGSRELLLDDAKALAEKARLSGVATYLEIWEEMIHAWALYSGKIPEGEQAIEKMGEFILAVLNGKERRAV